MFQHKLLSKRQKGFKRGTSTALQLLKVLDQWTQAIDDGLCTDIIYMYFQKAFNTVPLRRLLNKIESYGIGGIVV
jgi:hypothetical protein